MLFTNSPNKVKPIGPPQHKEYETMEDFHLQNSLTQHSSHLLWIDVRPFGDRRIHCRICKYVIAVVKKESE